MLGNYLRCLVAACVLLLGGAATAAEPSKAAQVAEPSKAAQVAEPSKAAQVAEPSKAAQVAEPSKAAQVAEPSKAAQVAEPSKAAQVAEPSKAAQVAEPSKAAQVAEPSKAAQVAEPSKAAQVAEPSKAAQVAEPSKAAQVAEPSKAAQVAEPSKAAQVAEPSKAAQVAEPSKAAQVKERLRSALPHVNFRVLGPSKLPGMYEVLTEDGTFLHVSKDARWMVVGDLYELSADGLRNRSQEQLAAARQQQLAAIPQGEVIRFAPKKVPSRTSIWVFTDVSCHYCRRFHQEMQAINHLGITVNYLAFPRGGPTLNNPAMQKLVTAWCADDPASTLTKLKSGEEVPIKLCANHPVLNHYQLGLKMGVNGTPAVVTETGYMLPGYRPAHELARALGL